MAVAVAARDVVARQCRPPTAPRREEVRGLDEFVKSGGTIVAWNQGARVRRNALHLPVRNIVAGVESSRLLHRRFSHAGDRPTQRSPSWPECRHAPMCSSSTAPCSRLPTASTEPCSPSFRRTHRRLRSGFLSGPQYIQGFAAALDVKHERGHVVLFAFQPQWRGQPTGTFRTVFNAASFRAPSPIRRKERRDSGPRLRCQRALIRSGRGGRGRGVHPRHAEDD